jgi:hypothetical protein
MDRFSYIGVCDFPNREQSLKSAQLFQRLCGEYKVENRKLMVGVMMSFKTLTGVPSKWTDIFPKKEDVAGIFVDHPFVFNTLHFADYDFKTSTAHLIEAAEWAGPLCHAIQLDMIWPPSVIVKNFRKKFPNMQVVLQVNTHALQEVQNNPKSLVHWLKGYEGVVDYALLDKSHGRGVGMDTEVLLPFALAIAEHLPWLGVVGAGGLGPGTVKLIEPIKRVIPTVSWDAQGRLRPSGSAEYPIDPLMVDQYLFESIELCAG